MTPSILFDARLVLEKPTGIGQYITSLLPELVAQAPDWHFHLLRRARPWPDYGLTVLTADNVTHHVSAVPHMSVQQQLAVPWLGYKLGVQLLHYPHFDAPVLWRQIPVVATIHDNKYLMHPHFFPSLSQVKRRYMHWCFSATLRRAAAVIAVSHHTAQDLATLFGPPTAQVAVIYEAANPRFQPRPAAVTAFRSTYQLTRPFILSVGERRPHKNHVGLIRAYAASASRHTHDLVILGQAYQEYTAPEETAQQLGLSQQIHFISHASDQDLTAAYTAADLFVLVSFYEGFGLPILEAMNCDTPVITSSTTSSGEVAGDGGITVNPTDAQAITAAIDTILQTSGQREALLARCRAWRQRFSWHRAAQETLALYQDVLKKQG